MAIILPNQRWMLMLSSAPARGRPFVRSTASGALCAVEPIVAIRCVPVMPADAHDRTRKAAYNTMGVTVKLEDHNVSAPKGMMWRSGVFRSTVTVCLETGINRNASTTCVSTPRMLSVGQPLHTRCRVGS